ncbi:MAG: hypothetical protein GT589_03685 [Peptoclostridium sp.]|uniref:hypothetical protein n=1 Tax=Peptoclostridium sp. TaxID=1904860 RepID=UPI00139E98CB|nr:hypothetical protein [Peptoclostridium sp.]MZQ75242.1 hypothetical protein [Peptoclostridium sp.]
MILFVCHLQTTSRGHGKRQQTEETDMCAALCVFCHINVHNNRKYDLELKRLAQDRYREKGYSDDEIRKLVGGKLYD